MTALTQTRRRGFHLDGSALENQMATRGITAEQLAHAAGLSQDTISRARRGRAIDTASMNKICDALETIPARRMLTKGRHEN